MMLATQTTPIVDNDPLDLERNRRRRRRSAVLIELVAYSVNTLFSSRNHAGLPFMPWLLGSFLIEKQIAVKKMVMCSDCYYGTNVEPQWISYVDIVHAIIRVGALKATVQCPRHCGPVFVNEIAPDLASGVIKYLPCFFNLLNTHS